MSRQLPPVAVAIGFVDRINTGDVDGLSRLMSPDHRLQVFDEAPIVGRDANVEAWRGYAQAFPEYVIYPHRIAERDGRVAIVGHTTGSHLGLPADEERALTLIWLVTVADGLVSAWELLEDTDETRAALGLDGV
jgi:hypothetical protein